MAHRRPGAGDGHTSARIRAGDLGSRRCVDVPDPAWRMGQSNRKRDRMTLEVLADVESVARRAAELIAAEARAAVEARGRFTLAISGGRTPWVMLRAL